MLPLLLSLLSILKDWLHIESIRASWQLERDIESYCDNVEDQIARARADGDDALADRLRERLVRSSGILVSSKRDS